MGNTYEGMFVLDNQAVRADWNRAKSVVTDLLAKHGATVLSARRWDERKLSYTIKGKTRATYLLAYFEVGAGGVNEMRRDLELDETVLRYLIVRADLVPAGELEKSAEESGADFTIPPPPTEEAQSFERRVFGDLADRPIHEPSRHSDRNEPSDDVTDAEMSDVPEAVAVEES